MFKLLSMFFVLISLAENLAVNYKEQSISYILTQEPPSLDGMLQATSAGIFILGHVKEGLLTYSPRGKIVPGVAKSYKITANGAIFYLRRDSYWSDGIPVKAQDFVFAWREVVNPKKASRYAFIMYPIKNAEMINNGILPLEKLGVKALDDFTLQVEFEKPCAYFEQLVAFQVYYPVREDFYKKQANKYAANKENILYNGPFIMTDWQHEKKIVLEKNINYWNADQVKLNKINIYRMTNSNVTKLNEFLDGGNVLTNLDSKTIKIATKKKILMKSYADGFLHYLEFNHRSERLGSYKEFRQAIQAVYNADELVNRVIGVPSNKEGNSLFPSWLRGQHHFFHQEYPLKKKHWNKGLVVQLLEKLKKKLQVTELPAITLLVGDSLTASKVAEYLQILFKKELGLTVYIDKQTFKQRLEKSMKGQFDIVLTAWGPDYNDLMTFGDLFASWNKNNRGAYKSKRYDNEIKKATSTVDKASRLKAFATLQQIIEDNAVIIPLYENGSIYVQHPNLRAVVRPIIGPNPWFKFAFIRK